jgi:subtilisin family serine protease
MKVVALKNSGKVLVAAAGNDNTTAADISDPYSHAFPGSDPDAALRVMATEENDCRAYFSNFSPSTNSTQYNIAAPGWKYSRPFQKQVTDTLRYLQASVWLQAAALVWGSYLLT